MFFVKRLITAAASAALLITAGTAPITSAAAVTQITVAVSADKTAARYPDWVPGNYLEALEFSNAHGETFVDNNYVCIVQQRPLNDDTLFREIVCSGSAVEDNQLKCVFSKDIEYSKNDAPDPEDTEAYSDYMKRLKAAGIKEDSEGLDNYFRVEVYSTLHLGFEATLNSGYYYEGEPVTESSRTFKFNYYSSYQTIEQLDLFRFLPDSVEEYDAFIKEHGNICAYNDFVIFCGDVIRAAGEQFFMEQHGEGMVKELMSYDVEYRSPQMFGPPVDTLPLQRAVKVYQPVNAGEAYIDFAVSRNITPNEEDIDTRCFSIEWDDRTRLHVIENKKDLPQWIPSDLSSAVQFDNQYGATHIEDGYICCVRRMTNNGKGYTQRCYMDDLAKGEKYNCQVYSKVFSFPEAVSSGEEGYDEYIAELGKLGIREKDIPYAKTDVCYSVNVFKPNPESRINIYWNKMRGNLKSDYSSEYALNFSVDRDGNITETDLFGWLPDCLAEAKEYIESNGNISVHDEYVIFCSVGFSFRVDPTQEGTSEIKMRYDFPLEPAGLIDIVGSMCGEVIIYKATIPGTLTVDFHYSGGTSQYEPKDKAECSFRFDNDLKASIISKEECVPHISGDCNYDGIVGISDVVVLQRWLLGTGASITAANADMNKDGIIDAFDLISLKKLLIRGSENCCIPVADSKPMLAVIYENHAWSTQQHITVFDENGTGYSMEYSTYTEKTGKNSYSELIRLHDDSSWYETLTGIIHNENAVISRMSDTIVGRTRELSAGLAEHKDDKLGKYIGKMCDAGQSSIYLIGKDADGKPFTLEIFTDGDVLSWTDCKELQEYLKESCYYLSAVSLEDIHELEANE